MLKLDKGWEEFRVWMVEKRWKDYLLELFVYKYKLMGKCFIAGGIVAKPVVGVVYKKNPKDAHLVLK